MEGGCRRGIPATPGSGTSEHISSIIDLWSHSAYQFHWYERIISSINVHHSMPMMSIFVIQNM